MKQTLVRAIDMRSSYNVVVVCAWGGAEGKDGKQDSTPGNSTNKTFQVLTLQKAHEPPESERFLTRKIA